MGTITFLVIKAGLLAITPQSGAALSTPGTTPNELMWLVAFLAGFSDRFSDGLLNTLMGNIAKAKPVNWWVWLPKVKPPVHWKCCRPDKATRILNCLHQRVLLRSVSSNSKS
jgi:hypothetical protein